MIVSIIIPAFNASSTIQRTLDSIFSTEIGDGWETEVIVVDDGSKDSLELSKILKRYRNITHLAFEKNRGVIAARNLGISHSTGDIVILLDADDCFVQNWFPVFLKIHKDWNKKTFLCLALCVNQFGNLTCPNYKGYISLEDFIRETYSGEYIPIFDGDYIRGKLYTDLGRGMACESMTYLRMLHDAPFYVSNNVLRIYYEGVPNSLSSNWTSQEKSRRNLICNEAIFSRYGQLFKEHSKKIHAIKLLKMSIYCKLANIPGKYFYYTRGVHASTVKESILVFILLLLPVKLVSYISIWGNSKDIKRKVDGYEAR